MPRLVVIGSSNTDMTVRLPRLPEAGETVLGGSLLTGPGGKGANQAVAAARAGAEVVFVSAVGNDAFGQAALDHYRSEGIDVTFVRRVEGASGVALIFVGDQGENMIGVASGANDRLRPEEIVALPDRLFRSGDVLLIAGLEIPIPSVVAAMARGAGAGMTVVLNPAPANRDLLRYGDLTQVDVLTPNRGELATLAGEKVESTSQLLAAAKQLTSLGVRHVVTTLGAQGCHVLSDSSNSFSGDGLQVSAYTVTPVDTVGAGDAFSAALAVALLERRPIFEAVSWAMAAAAITVTRPGAQLALPRRAEIDQLFDKHG